MSKNVANQNQNVNWRSDEVYKRISQEINNWPEWKKEAYNEMVAFSAHANKLSVGKR